MKKIVLFSTVALAALMTGCVNDDERFYPQGEGRLIIAPEIKSDISVVTRAAANEDELNNSLILWISNSNGVIRKYNGLENVPENEWLKAGDYLAEAWAGDSVPASFTDRWFKGSQSFSIRSGESTHITIPCYIANVLVEVVYDEGVAEGFKGDPVFTVGHSRGSLVYDNDHSLGYFMVPSTDKDITWTFEAMSANNSKIVKEGIIENAQPATKYILKVKAGSADAPVGGTFFDVYVDQDAEAVYPEFIIELAPVIDGWDFDANHKDVFKQGEIGERSIFISASAPITNAVLSVDAETADGRKNLSQLLGDMIDGDGNVLTQLDFMRASQTLLDQVASYGIHAEFDPIEGSIESSLTVIFKAEFTNSLPAGTYVFDYSVTDQKGRHSSLSRTLKITDSPLEIKKANDYDVWASEATIYAGILNDDFGSASFQYRQVGSDSWSNISPSVNLNDKILTGKLSGLSPGATYEYRIISDLDNFESDVMSFTTEAALQLPNSGFEDWCKPTIDKKEIQTPSVSLDELFWDCGNQGSMKMNETITDPDGELKHSGNYSLKMSSKFVSLFGIGKLAAGNCFIGQYLKTDGTDGVLGWGREFKSRPKALKGYIKYNPVAVTQHEDGDLNVGDMDEGIIYIALLDNSLSGDNDYPNWPVVIRTKKSQRKLFDKNGSNVIAYGEKIFSEATSGENMIEFEIPLTYFKENVKSSYIMVTMSASRCGDYYTGGNGSTMWIDDLELVY